MPSAPAGAPPHRRQGEVNGPGDPAGKAGKVGFRPDIEGLRAIAILTVLAYHAGLPVRRRLRGCRRLLRDLRLPHHRAAGRRARPQRLHLVDPVRGQADPATVAGGRARAGAHVRGFVVRGAGSAPSRHRRRHRGGGRLRRQLGVRPSRADYLASDVLPSPVQHFWSLAVEEQFYVVWPLLLIVLALVVRRPSRRVVAMALGTLVASSFVWSVWFSHHSPRPAFFTTTTRAWELGIGALLAVALAGRPRSGTPARGSAALGWAALVALVAVALWLPTDIDWPAPGRCCRRCRRRCSSGSAGGVRPRAGARAGNRADGPGGCPVLLDLPLALAGHHPRRLGRRRLGATLPAWGVVLLALGSVLPAWLSWRFVGPPIHHGPWLRDRPRALLGAGLALSCVGGGGPAPALAPLPVHHDATRRALPRWPSSAPPRSKRGNRSCRSTTPGWVTPDPLVSGQDRPRADVDHCQVGVDVSEPVACTFGDPQGTTTVALVGDSKAMQWLPALEEAVSTRRWRVVTYGKSSCASPTPRRPRRAPPTRSATPRPPRSWKPWVPTGPTSS